MTTRIDVERGAEYLLPYAKKKLRELDGLDIDRRFITATTGERIYVQRGEVDYIRITAAPTAAVGYSLYNWRSSPLPAYPKTSVTNITLSASGRPIVAAGPLPPLGTGLAFDIIAPPSNPSFVLEVTSARYATLLPRAIQQGSWFAYELLARVLARYTVITPSGVLATNIADCLISEWDPVGKTCWILIGTFPSATPAFPMPTVTYKGALIRLADFIAAMDDSTFFLNLVTTPFTPVTTGYQRKFVGSVTAGNDYESVIRMPTTCPYINTFMGYTGANPPFPDLNFSVGEYYGFRLGTDGEVVRVDLTASIVRGEQTTTINNFLGGFDVTLSGMTCDMTFFTGERFLKYGTHTFSGGTVSTPPTVDSGVTAVTTGRIPLSTSFTNTVPLQSFIFVAPEAGAIVADSGAGLEVYGMDETGPMGYVLNRAGTAASVAAGIGSNHAYVWPTATQSFQSTAAGPFTGGSGIEVQVLFGHGSAISVTPTAQISALPSPLTAGYFVSGVYWYRDGPMGVLYFQVPTAAPARAARDADVTKYRALMAGSIPIGDPTYEDPPAVLARIISATVVLVNNFASEELIPWVDNNMVGIIT